MSIFLLILVRRTKPRLHTMRHLLVCNTCIASILYCIIQLINYTFLIFLPEETSDIGCRWRGYFSYLTICAVAYSFLIQAISRLFISIFSRKDRWLTSLKVHCILITIQWFVSISLPLPAIITKDIYFRPNSLCWVPLKSRIHVCYTYITYYIIPTLIVCVIYLLIYYRVKKMRSLTQMSIGTINNEKRNLKLLGNILILLGIYLMGGTPSLLFVLTSNKILYLIGIVTISLTVAIEKLCTILLDRELRKVIRKLLTRRTRITPRNNTYIARHQENLTPIRRTAVQSLQLNKTISVK